VTPRPAASGGWTLAEAEGYLLSLELFGMRFGLDRMRRLMTALGQPERAFRSIHVVGTNGKSSTARMTAAILQRHGLRAGAYLSPHLVSFAERIRIDGEDVAAEDFGAAVERAARAAGLVDRTLPADDKVTQFEALTAAAYSELAEQHVEVAVVEAGLGGRYDATNVIDSSVQVLTNVGLEHTRWLGPTVADISREKLDVVTSSHPPGTLVVGDGLHPEALALAERTAAERGARLVHAPADPGVEVLAQGGFQRRNFACAMAAAEAFLGRLDPEAVRAAAASTLVPGRFQLVDQQPDTIYDGAHNPGGIGALAETLPAFTAGRPLVAVVSILDDKEAGAMLRELLPHCSAIVATTNASPRALSPATIGSLAGQLGARRVHAESDPHAAVAVARQLAGPQGVVLATGSIYLIADLLRPVGAGRGSML
jgi:dihydrofolate synthase / folylpolyglutamate synthase